jgi:hypothetical protein
LSAAKPGAGAQPGNHPGFAALNTGLRVDGSLCVDNFFTGTKDNIAHLLPSPHFELIPHDVTFPLYVEIDEIYNLACPASPIHYQHDPVQTTKTSVHGAINMLGLTKRAGRIPAAVEPADRALGRAQQRPRIRPADRHGV